MLTKEEISKITADWINDDGPAYHDIEAITESHEELREIVSAYERSFARVASLTGSADPSEGCSEILKEVKRVLMSKKRNT